MRNGVMGKKVAIERGPLGKAEEKFFGHATHEMESGKGNRGREGSR